jgi:uncharacterized protein (DUF1778 family)
VTLFLIEERIMPSTAATEKSKQQRIDLRTTAEIKERLARAAALTGTTISSFLISAALERANRVIAEEQIITLSQRDWDRLMAVLDNPPPPNAALKEAMREYLAMKERQRSE